MSEDYAGLVSEARAKATTDSPIHALVLQLAEAVSVLSAELTEARANAWDEGYDLGERVALNNLDTEPNPYRALTEGTKE